MDISALLYSAATWWKWLLVVVCVLVMLLNSKVRVLAIFAEQVKVFKSNKSGKTSVLDLSSFLICPIVLAALIVCGFGFVIDSRLAEALTTAFSLIFTLLFAFEAILVDNNGNEIALRWQVTKETFVSIMTASLLSLTADILSIFIMFVTHAAAVAVLTACVLALSFMIVMLLLLIVKRTFKLYMNDKR